MTTNPVHRPILGPCIMRIAIDCEVGVALEVRGANGQRKGSWQEDGANKCWADEAKNQKMGG